MKSTVSLLTWQREEEKNKLINTRTSLSQFKSITVQKKKKKNCWLSSSGFSELEERKKERKQTRQDCPKKSGKNKKIRKKKTEPKNCGRSTMRQRSIQYGMQDARKSWEKKKERKEGRKEGRKEERKKERKKEKEKKEWLKKIDKEPSSQSFFLQLGYNPISPRGVLVMYSRAVSKQARA